jgi:hypothetical protein
LHAKFKVVIADRPTGKAVEELSSSSMTQLQQQQDMLFTWETKVQIWYEARRSGIMQDIIL